MLRPVHVWSSGLDQEWTQRGEEQVVCLESYQHKAICPQLCVQPHGLFILCPQPMHNSLTSQCWQKAAQEVFSSVPCIFHLPKVLLWYQAPSFPTEIWTKHLPQHLHAGAQLLSLERLAPLPCAGLYTCRPCALLLWRLLVPSLGGHRWQMARLQGYWWDPGKTKVVSGRENNRDTLSRLSSPAISHSGKCPRKAAWITRKFHFEKDSNSTTLVFLLNKSLLSTYYCQTWF